MVILWTFGVAVAVLVVIRTMVSFNELVRVTLLGSGNKSGASFDPDRDMPSQAGKVVLITGGAGDLGRQAAVEFARHGAARIYIADLPRADGGAAAVGAIRDEVPGAAVSFLPVDLASFDSVKKAAAQFRAAEDRLDICILNAGIIRVRTGLSAEGYEITFATNYMGHALLAKLLTPTLLQTASARPGADVRVVVVSSEGHLMAPRGGILFDKLKTTCDNLSYTQRYGQSKVGSIILARQLARLHPQLKVVSIHPGRVITGMARNLAEESFIVRISAPLAPLICTSVATGVKNHLWASTADVVSGTYYEPVGVPDRESATAKEKGLSAKLWEWTENEFKKYEGAA